jgi:predicted nucleotidyltransferase component of viral defense system
MDVQKYKPFVELLLKVLPYVVVKDTFALKGGTAINLFLHDMPRLSIDIDLTYLPLKNRSDALKDIQLHLHTAEQQIGRFFPDIQVKKSGSGDKLYINSHNAQIKVEPNCILRGALYPCEEKELSPSAQQEFKTRVETIILSTEDLYGGKLCAALDRQHPRDLFDVKVLFDHEGLTDTIRKAFVVYVASHNRPMAEILDPTFQDFQESYRGDFVGMARLEATLDELVQTRQRLLSTIHQTLTREEKEFLLSIKQGEPQWSLIDIAHIENLPAIQWKLQNIRRMDKVKHQHAVQKLKSVLGL